MSREYDLYLEEHKLNVKKSFEWLREHLPGFVAGEDYEWQIVLAHDHSKSEPDEYRAYDNYFYGSRSYSNVRSFKRAWLKHMHRNPHHWQHWVLINDDKEEGIEALDMPDKYIVEMVCDWWSFSWACDDLYSMFTWYEQRKDGMILSDGTRVRVEHLLTEIKKVLDN